MENIDTNVRKQRVKNFNDLKNKILNFSVFFPIIAQTLAIIYLINPLTPKI